MIYQCKNFRKGYVPCEMCVLNKTYVVLQQTDCKSCFQPETNSFKPV